MNTLTFRRHYKLIIAFILILVGACVFSTTRIISYNFGEYSTKISSESLNYTNSMDIFDDSIMHNISLDLTQAQYDEMVTSYKKNSEKEWQKVNITIDGVTIPNVGIRLKGNLTLRTTLGVGMGGGGNMGRGGDRMMGPNGFTNNGSGSLQTGRMFPEGDTADTGTGTTGNQRMGGGGPGSGYSFELPGFLIAFDKYTDGQTYEGISRIALRIGNDPTFLNELTAYSLFKELGYIAPEAVYSAIQFGEIGTYLYEVSELPGDEYVEKYFPDTNGTLYKAGNSVGFHYEGDDPTLYTDTFEVASGKKKNDLSPLIKLLKFVTNSTTEEFSGNVEKYIDLDSLYTLMAVDELIGNSDSFGSMGSNFYIYINSDTGIATFLPWDYNLAFGGLGGGMGGGRGFGEGGSGAVDMPRGLNGIRPEIMGSGAMMNAGFPGRENANAMQGAGGMGGMGQNINDLKTKILANTRFSAEYQAKLEELRTKIYTDGLAKKIIEQYADVYYNSTGHANLVSEDDYVKYLDQMRSYISAKVTEEKME